MWAKRTSKSSKITFFLNKLQCRRYGLKLKISENLDKNSNKNDEIIEAQSGEKQLDVEEYKEILSEVSKTKKSLAAALLNSSFKNEGNIIYIKTNKTSAAILLKQTSNQEVLRLAAKKVTGREYLFKLEKTNVLDDNIPSKQNNLESFINDIKNTDIDININ